MTEELLVAIGENPPSTLARATLHEIRTQKKVMGTVHIIFGPQGAGKSTYARKLSLEIQGVRFSIDEWMHQLFGPDQPQPISFSWVIDRVRRCEKRIWATALEVALAGGNVVLDLGFMKVESRSEFQSMADAAGLSTQLHFIDAPHAVRKERVLTRNAERGETFSFEVTSDMFDFMEREFQRPTDKELCAAI